MFSFHIFQIIAYVFRIVGKNSINKVIVYFFLYIYRVLISIVIRDLMIAFEYIIHLDHYYFIRYFILYTFIIIWKRKNTKNNRKTLTTEL